MNYAYSELGINGMKILLTLMSRLRAALEFKNAKSIAAWSINARLVASGNLTSRAVNNCEGP